MAQEEIQDAEAMIPKLYSPAQLPEPLDLFGQLIAQAPFAVWVADQEGNVILFNEAMRKLVNIEDPDKVLEHYNIFEDPIAKSQGLIPYIRKVLEGQVVQTVVMLDLSRENFGKQESPKVYYVRSVYFPLKDHYGEPEYVVTLIENITPDYLVDLAFSKAAHDLDARQEEIIAQEKEILEQKKAIERLESQLKSIEHGV